MKALILAAGQGRRLWPYTADLPKCLLSVGPAPILAHQLAALSRAGIRQGVIVCGFGVAQIQRFIERRSGPLRLKVLYNPFYAQADNFISLWTARSELDGDTLLLNGDNLFHPAVVERLDESAADCCLLARRKDRYGEDDMKLQLDGDQVRRIGKSLPAASVQAESVGIVRFSANGAALMRERLEKAVFSAAALDSYFLAAIQEMIEAGTVVHCRDIGDRFWSDVDTPADLRRVRQQLHRFAPGASGLSPVRAGAQA